MTDLEEAFPGLRATEYEETSPTDSSYNCIAWAADVSVAWWEPDPWGQYCWPTSAAREYTLDAYVEAYAGLGYERCATPDRERGCLKVAIFVDRNGKPTHAARQLPSGRWTSKLGREVDIEHELHALEGKQYGRVAVIMKRETPSDVALS